MVEKDPNVVITEFYGLGGTRWYTIKSKPYYHSTNPIPEHPSSLLTKETNRNKACQTHTAYEARWPELYMEPTEYFIIPRNQSDKLTDTTTLILTLKNEKETQTNSKTIHNLQTTHKHNWSKPAKTKLVQHYHVPFATQLLGAETTENGQTPQKTGDDLLGTSSELQEETIRLAQLLGSISMTNILKEREYAWRSIWRWEWVLCRIGFVGVVLDRAF